MAIEIAGENAKSQSRKRDALKRAEQWMTKGGIIRDDSDDELGYDDLPWEWIYDSEAGDSGEPENTAENGRKTPRSARRRSRQPQRNILGARMGDFECKVGEIILLKSPEPGKNWIGIITEFVEEDDDEGNEPIKSANIMWFASPDEFISTRNKRRADALPNEQYLTTDFNVNPLTSINGKAQVMSKDAFFARYPDGARPKAKDDLAEYNKCIVCRRGVSQLQGRYTEEFVWEDVYKQDQIHELVDMIKDGLKAAKKRKQVDTEYVETNDTVDEAPTTPRKRQKIANATPQSKRQKAMTTPSNKRIIVKKPLEFTPLGTRVLSPAHFASPYRQARNLLHVSTVPDSLPCRKNEFDTVYSHLSAAIMEGTGTCIYISGTPGTGKTATVREVVAQLNSAVLAEEMDDFIFVEINGMKVTDPHQSYSLLWEALKGDRVSPSHALDLLDREFSNPSPRRVSCVVLMDELDQLVTKNQSVMYNFFNWPALRHSRLIVLAVANTMDLPERTLSNKISSRLGLTRITFPGYTHTNLMEIITTRLASVPGNIVDSDAIQFASRKVAAVSGDARRALDICRRAVEIAEQSSFAAEAADPDAEGEADDIDSMPPTPSKTPARREKAAAASAAVAARQASLLRSPQKPSALGTPRKGGQPGRVTIATIKQAINEATSTPLQQSLRCLPLSAKLFLAALLARVRRTGITESTFGDVIDEAKRIADAAVAVAGAAGAGIKDFLLPGGFGSVDGAGTRVQALGFAAMELMNSGVLALETSSGRGGLGGAAVPSRGDRSGKVRLRVAAEDVRAAFRDDVEAKGLGLGIEA